MTPHSEIISKTRPVRPNEPPGARLSREDHDRAPVKPVIDGEPIYEDVTLSFHHSRSNSIRHQGSGFDAQGAAEAENRHIPMNIFRLLNTNVPILSGSPQKLAVQK